MTNPKFAFLKFANISPRVGVEDDSAMQPHLMTINNSKQLINSINFHSIRLSSLDLGFLEVTAFCNHRVLEPLMLEHTLEKVC